MLHMIVILSTHPKHPIEVAADLSGPMLLYGKAAKDILHVFQTGELSEDYSIQLGTLPSNQLRDCYLLAEDFSLTRHAIAEYLNLRHGYVFLDTSNILEENLPSYLDEIVSLFPNGKIIIFANSAMVGPLALASLDKNEESLHERGAYEDELIPFVYDVMEVHEENGILVRNKKPKKVKPPREIKRPKQVEEGETREPNPLPSLFLPGQAKDLWQNLGFTCFFMALCFLLPLVTLAKQDAEENLKVISTILGVLFALFACYPTISNINYMIKKDRWNIVPVMIAISIHFTVGLVLAAVLTCIIGLNSYEGLAYVYVGYLGITPILAVIYFIIILILKSKEKKSE